MFVKLISGDLNPALVPTLQHLTCKITTAPWVRGGVTWQLLQTLRSIYGDKPLETQEKKYIYF